MCRWCGNPECDRECADPRDAADWYDRFDNDSEVDYGDSAVAASEEALRHVDL